MSQKYRVFISYCRENANLVELIEKALKDQGVIAMRDKTFAFGSGFHEQIKTYIAHAHVFLPLITKESADRIWVQQEIGYAMSSNIPVLPVVKGKESKLQGMPAQLHAVKFTPEPRKLGRLLSKSVIENLVSRYLDAGLARYQTAEYPEDRAMLMARYANEVIKLGCYGQVRQKGGLSSFHIPKEIPTHPDWERRYPKGSEHRQFMFRELRKERIALEAHSRQSGCRVIVSPNSYRDYDRDVQIARLEHLIAFLDQLAPDYRKFQVVCDKKKTRQTNVTIVGDWFSAESVSVPKGGGYQQTIFNRHAPSMQNKVELFDEEFRALANGYTPKELRKETRKRLENKIKKLKR